MDLETIHFTMEDDVAYLTFDRPEVRNAINMKMLHELEFMLTELEQQDDLIAFIMTGRDKAFCAGADTTEFLNVTVEENQQFLKRFWDIIRRIEQLPMPIIGIINGFAFGGGAEIATACDFRIAVNGASFRFPGASYGLVVSSRTLPLLVGVSKAKELLFRSSIIHTDEALRIGLVDQVIEADEVESYCKTMIEEMKGNSMLAVRKTKEVINKGIGASAKERWQLEDDANDYLVNNTNYRETFSAFVETLKKRK